MVTTEAAVRRAVDARFAQVLAPVAFFAASAMALVVAMALVARGWAYAGFAGGVGLTMAGMGLLLRGPGGAPLRSYPALVASTGGLVVAAVPLSYVWRTGSFVQDTGMTLILVGVGAVLFDRRAALTTIAIIDLAWIAVGLSHGIEGRGLAFASAVGLSTVAALGLHVIVLRTVRDLERSRCEVDRLANSDPLTGVGNRRFLTDRGRALVERARDARTPLDVVALDMDDLKEVNDTLGHAAGDERIRSLAELLARIAGPDDVVARLGGDEFVLLRLGADDGPEDAAPALARELEQQAAAAGFATSVGVVRAQDLPRDTGAGELLERLLADADAALYRAKSRRAAPEAPPRTPR